MKKVVPGVIQRLQDVLAKQRRVESLSDQNVDRLKINIYSIQNWKVYYDCFFKFWSILLKRREKVVVGFVNSRKIKKLKKLNEIAV